MIFVVVTVPHGSADEIELGVVTPYGELIRRDRVNLDSVSVFLQDWLMVPSTQVIFVASLLSGMNTAILRRHLEDLGFYNVSFNGIAYCSLTDVQLLDKYNETLEVVAEYFAHHLAVDTQGHVYAPFYRTEVYVALTYDASCGFTLAAGTLFHGVQLSKRLHYNSDICEALIPWLSKPLFYNIVLICNYLSSDALAVVNKVLTHHLCSLSQLDVTRMDVATANFLQFCRGDRKKPNYNFARAVLEEFIVQKRLRR